MTGGLLAGRRGLIMGVANDKSIAWGVARAAARHGAELAFTYQTEGFARRVKPLAESVGSDFLIKCDVADDADLDATFEAVRERWGGLDFVVHAIAYSDKNELDGSYLDTSRRNFRDTLSISAYSFTGVAQRALPLMDSGGSLLTLTYLGAERVTPNYNVMGVAKAALEASVRYLAADLGPRGIRVNALSAGPMRTLAGSAIADARYVFRASADQAPLNRNVELDEVGNAGVYLLSDFAEAVTGEVHHVDGGQHAVAMTHPDRANGEKG